MIDPIATLRNRRQTYTFVVGAVAGALVAGLLVPLAIGHPDRVNRSRVTASAPGADAGGPASADPGAASTDVTPPPPIGATSGAPGSQPLRSAASSTSTRRVFGSATPSGGGGTAARTASDRGVSPTEIKLGVLLVSFGGANQIGAGVTGYDPATQQRYFDAYIDEVNAHGGAAGRKVVPVYRTVDILDQKTMTAACNQLTQDDKVFAVTNVLGVYGDPILCVTKQNTTPYLSYDGAISSYYTQSNGYLVTTQPSTLRTISNMAYRLLDVGELKRGDSVGLLSEDGYLSPDFKALASLLRSNGVTVTQQEVSSSDTSSAASEMPTAVQAFRAAGVAKVLLLVNELYAGQFVNDAEPTGFSAYFESDFDYEMAGDGFLANMPADYYGHAISVSSTRVGDPRTNAAEPAFDASCRTIYDARAKTTTARTSDGYWQALDACGLVDVFVTGVANAGVNPTRASFVAAIGRLGSFPNPGFGSSSFKPGKTDGPDVVRMDQAFADCKCWKPLEAFRANRVTG